MTKLVLALSGWKRSGKDAVAEFLVQQGFTRLAFADTLKEMVAGQYGIPLADMYDQNKKEAPLPNFPVTPRDKFSQMIAEFMFKEFKTIDGKTPDRYEIQSGTFYGVRDIDIGQVYEQLYFTPRAILIAEGSYKRSIAPDYWVDRTINKMDDKSGLYVIPDLRYRSEIDVLRRRLGEAVVFARIDRWDVNPSNDPSECDLNDYNFEHILNNRKDLNSMLDQAAKLVNSKLKKG